MGNEIYINYGKIETGTNWRMNLDEVTFFLISPYISGDLQVDSAWFYKHAESQKTNSIYSLRTNTWFINNHIYGLCTIWRFT